MTFQKLSASQKQAIKKGVIEVESNTMNATALGVVAALLKIYPKLTFAELKEMLPDEINPGFDKFGNAMEGGKKYDSLFKPTGERLYGVIQPGSIREESLKRKLDITKSHFTGEGQTFNTSDGVEVLVSKKWQTKDAITGENDIQNLINHVEQYGVKVASFESQKTFKKGEYSLNVINANLLDVIQRQTDKKNLWWIFLIVMILVGFLLILISKQ